MQVSYLCASNLLFLCTGSESVALLALGWHCCLLAACKTLAIPSVLLAASQAPVVLQLHNAPNIHLTHANARRGVLCTVRFACKLIRCFRPSLKSLVPLLLDLQRQNK